MSCAHATLVYNINLLLSQQWTLAGLRYPPALQAMAQHAASGTDVDPPALEDPGIPEMGFQRHLPGQGPDVRPAAVAAVAEDQRLTPPERHGVADVLKRDQCAAPVASLDMVVHAEVYLAAGRGADLQAAIARASESCTATLEVGGFVSRLLLSLAHLTSLHGHD